MSKKIKMSSLAQTKHVKFLILLEKQSKMTFEIVLKKLYLSIGKSLRKEGLAKSESLEKGLKGDWQKEGYTLKHIPNKFGHPLDHKYGGDYIKAYAPSGEEVGSVFFGSNTPDTITPSTKVHPAHQRKGLASGMYALAEKVSGRKMTADVHSDTGLPNPEGRSADAKALWAQPNRPFGKAEELEKGQAGDWKKEGYTLHHRLAPGNESIITAKDPNGKNVGYYNIGSPDGAQYLYVSESETFPDHQRKGLATAAYQMAEKIHGKKIAPEHLQTFDAKALWAQPNRPFGKALAKSDEDPMKLGEGWTGEVAKIEVDLEGAIARTIDRHFRALQYMIMGDYAGKEAKAAAKELGLKVVPGMMQSAYLQSIDAHREHHKAVTGTEAPELPKALMKGSLDEIAKRSKRFLEKTTGDMKLEITEAVDRVVRKTNQDSLNRVHKEAHDLLPMSGKDEALEEALNQSWDYVKMTDVKKELDGIEDKLVNKWALTSNTELANASATGTHQAMVEIYGGRDDSIRVVWMTLEDEKVCSFCEDVSKDKAGNYKFYKISDFKPTGSNYGKKKSEWQLQVPPAHPNCRCDLIYVPSGFTVGKDGTLVKG